MFRRKKTYYVQWRYDMLKMWFSGKDFRRQKPALRYAFSMLARNSNNCPWRIVEYDHILGEFHVVFESTIDRLPIREYNFRQFTGSEVEKYCTEIKKESKKR